MHAISPRMHKNKTLDRAFELAGKCHDMAELRHKLAREGHREHERALFGVSMRRQLLALMPYQKTP
jgi:hypothetical protein